MGSCLLRLLLDIFSQKPYNSYYKVPYYGEVKENMKKREDYITIGELSKLTGINVKSLLYYERIGVLRPAYVDGENGYRYYTYPQISLANAVQFYVGMDIPLKEINRFIDTKSSTLDCRSQISYGIETARHKLRLIQEQLAYAEGILDEINRFDGVISAEEAVSLDFPQKNCVLFPFEGKQTKKTYYSTRYRLLLQIQKGGYNVWYESGLLYRHNGSKWETFIFVDVGQAKNGSSQFFTELIPAGRYWCRETDFPESSPEVLGRSLYDGEKPKIMMFSELISSTFAYKESKFMLRWQV